MLRCSHCGELVSTHEAACPSCAKSLHRETNDVPMIPIARFCNAAEAGYFAHELHRNADIPATVAMDENFDAVSGYWSTRFVLAVPKDSSTDALLCMQRLIDCSDSDDMPFDTGTFEGDVGISAERDDRAYWPNDGMESDLMRSDEMNGGISEESGVNWVPIVLTLTAGSVVFWGLRAMHAKPQAGAVAAGERHRPDVWKLLSQPQRPWVQRLDKGSRELRFDSIRREGTLYEDLDGDGHFETKFRVRGFAPQQ